jgi:hypothetical protein
MLKHSDTASYPRKTVLNHTATRTSELGSWKRGLWLNSKKFVGSDKRDKLDGIILDRSWEEGLKK